MHVNNNYFIVLWFQPVTSCEKKNVTRRNVIFRKHCVSILHCCDTCLHFLLKTKTINTQYFSFLTEKVWAMFTFSTFCMMRASRSFWLAGIMWVKALDMMESASCTASLFSDSSCNKSYININLWNCRMMNVFRKTERSSVTLQIASKKVWSNAMSLDTRWGSFDAIFATATYDMARSRASSVLFVSSSKKSINK